MIGKTILTRSILREQDPDSRKANVASELLRQLEMQFGIEQPPLSERLSDLGFCGTAAYNLAKNIKVHFPFVDSAVEMVNRATTLDDLVRLILLEV